MKPSVNGESQSCAIWTVEPFMRVKSMRALDNVTAIMAANGLMRSRRTMELRTLKLAGLREVVMIMTRDVPCVERGGLEMKGENGGGKLGSFTTSRNVGCVLLPNDPRGTVGRERQ